MGKPTDWEELANNLARMVEQGGKALAAYLKPREEGRKDTDHAEFIDMVRTLGQVRNTGLPTRSARSSYSRGSARAISTFGRMRRGAWPARTATRWQSRIRATSASPIRNGRRTSSSTSSSRPTC